MVEEGHMGIPLNPSPIEMPNAIADFSGSSPAQHPSGPAHEA